VGKEGSKDKDGCLDLRRAHKADKRGAKKGSKSEGSSVVHRPSSGWAICLDGAIQPAPAFPGQSSPIPAFTRRHAGASSGEVLKFLADFWR